MASKLDRWVAKYQKLFRLQDWDITAEYAVPGDMDVESAIGQVNWTLRMKRAAVKIVPARMHPSATPPDTTEEGIVIHELLHLVLAPLDTPDERTRELEQAINALEASYVPFHDKAPRRRKR